MHFFKIFPVILLILYATVSFASSDNSGPTFQGHEKIGLDLKRQWMAAMKEGDLFQEVKCVVKMERPVDKKKLRELKKAGLKVGVTLKTVVTGKILIGDLPILVLVDGVKSVDSGVPVSPKEVIPVKLVPDIDREAGIK